MDDWRQKLHKLVRTGEQLAAAKADLASLEKAEKSVLAVEKSKSTGKTVDERDADARLSEAYVAWQEGYAAAVFNFEQQKVRYEALRTWFSMTQTEESTRREEMRLAR